MICPRCECGCSHAIREQLHHCLQIPYSPQPNIYPESTHLAKPNFQYEKRQKELEKKRKKEEKLKRKLEKSNTPDDVTESSDDDAAVDGSADS